MKKKHLETSQVWETLETPARLCQAIPRLVSELELEVMSSCLVRQGREVEEVIGSHQANLRYSEARIKGTYKEVFMQLQLGYCLQDGAQDTQLGIPELHGWHLALLYSLTMFLPYIMYCIHWVAMTQ